MKKDLLVISFIILFVIVAFQGTKIQSADEYYLTHIDDILPNSKTVTLSIVCSTILDNYDKLDPKLKNDNYVPIDGVILPPTKYVLRDKDTVYNILDRAVRHNKIQMEHQAPHLNSYGSVYIQGINYLYEFSCGPLSGWMYQVNEIFPNYGCSKYELNDGDIIKWLYTCDLGRDIGCKWLGGEFN